MIELNSNPQNQFNNINKFASFKKGHLDKSLHFNGALTRVAQKSPQTPAELLQAMNKIYPREFGIIGRIPSEFVIAIKDNLGITHPREIKTCVDKIRQTFAQTAKILEGIEAQTIDNMKKHAEGLNLEQYLSSLRQRLLLLATEDMTEALEIHKKMTDQFLPDRTYIKAIETQAQEVLNKGLKESKLIPEDANVTINRVDQGYFGTIYKLTFQDKNGTELFKPKVIKLFKDLKTKNKVNVDRFINEFRIVKKHHDSIIEFIEEFVNTHHVKGNPDAQCAIEEFRSRINRNYAMSEDDYKKKIFKEFFALMEEHGLDKETIFASYINKAVGNNLQNSDLIKFYYTDLNSKYSLLSFSDSRAIGKVTKQIDYDALGLHPHDIEGLSKLTNFVDGRLVDYGDFKITNEILATNPIARKTYKIIKKCCSQGTNDEYKEAIDKFNVMYKKARQNKLPMSSDVLLGLNEAKKIFPDIYQEKLLINTE